MRRASIDESVASLVEGVRASDRAVLGRVITLIESRKPEHQAKAQDILQALLPYSGKSHRVGISGVPGVGKSTLIESLGGLLTGRGHRVAVLAVDPSSPLTGGSILGDKTRMERLAVDPNAFIRPTPTVGTLGGVARRTCDVMLVCEAAGFDVVLIETVGVGQSEAVVAHMVDFFVVLLLPGAGDELQGIKRGILEVADLIAVNKADGDNLARAKRAKGEAQAALKILRGTATPTSGVLVTLCSGLTGDGLEKLWQHVEVRKQALQAAGEFEPRRAEQRVQWMWDRVRDGLYDALRSDTRVRAIAAAAEAEVRAGKRAPTDAARAVLAAFCGSF